MRLLRKYLCVKGMSVCSWLMVVVVVCCSFCCCCCCCWFNSTFVVVVGDGGKMSVGAKAFAVEVVEAFGAIGAVDEDVGVLANAGTVVGVGGELHVGEKLGGDA